MNLKRKLILISLFIVITLNASFIIAANADENNDLKTIKIADNNNIRNLPLSADVFVEKSKNGDRFSFINNKPNGWNNLKSLDSLYGIVCSDLFNKEIMDKANKTKEGFKKSDGWVKSEVLYLREGPSQEYKILEKLILGDQVNLVDKVTSTNNEEWYKITTPGNKTGWVCDKYISLKKVEKSLTNPSVDAIKSGEAIIATAKKYLGCPYVYGGRSPSGFDCSGFTSYVYELHGIKIPRSGRDIANFGSFVSISNLIPGDIVCFQNSSGVVYHVGIYVGNNNFIHAQNVRTGVVITNLYSAGYNGKFKCGRRIIK